ncbi:hypothetical protein PTSG_07728 [Salpingoeca rosetta]|uniref:Uncharacterized protein n=1 Tax=Salpingoeca rosetta (strain ATCC 50818 / BSB-021) TaxID=946362 RepID=F2UHL5_SALR5|nr:uncharacterized protein PTSG_07728 [Salpingoeca rosetta]EGD76614.1 hypothetical protein PTSG_07728 [Salpingoeca rosetta]|eukprot:XP_004991528.1 hypothetical protein PTSG_07728 [Salpingoeca rosetta]
MGLGSIVYFTAGGVFTGVYANAVRRRPVLASPGMLAACTVSGLALGYAFHRCASDRDMEAFKLTHTLMMFRYEETRTEKTFNMAELRDIKPHGN